MPSSGKESGAVGRFLKVQGVKALRAVDLIAISVRMKADMKARQHLRFDRGRGISQLRNVRGKSNLQGQMKADKIHATSSMPWEGNANSHIPHYRE
jgi:hypothetical protein